MKKRRQVYFRIAFRFLTAFLLWTIAICRIDVQKIGPQGSSVGFATLNRAIHNTLGISMELYTVTDWFGLVPVTVGFGFALLGLTQLVKRKTIRKVDFSILILGGFYIAVLAAYLFFEEFVVNYRPVLIDGFLEASYPSSTTMLVLCVMSTAIMQFQERIKNKLLLTVVTIVITTFIVFMVLGRLISGVHWFTDIVGGILLSAGLVMLYRAASTLKRED